MTEIENILEKTINGQRLGQEQALKLYEQADLYDLAQAAHEIRKQKHPESIVTYIVDRNINYSNICISGCKFCAFYCPPGGKTGFVLSKEEISQKIEETLAWGGTQILLQGSLHPDLKLSFYQDLLDYIKSNYPQIHIHGFSPPEIVHFSNLSGLKIEKVLQILIDSGLDSIPGGGAEILVDRVRKLVSPNKCTASQWLQIMETAHQLGLPTTATMMFGHLETLQERIEHLFLLRELQDKTAGFTAFIPWTFQPDQTVLSVRKRTTVEYLRLLAVARLVLDNFANLQASWVTMGAKIGQLALFFGANDFGSTMIEENVVAASGVSYRLSLEEIERNILEAGFVPRQRKMNYELVN